MAVQDNVVSYDKPAYAAASLRAPMRGEVYPITVLATSKTFVVPTAWKGRLVRFEADGGDVGIQVALDNTAAASLTAFCTDDGLTPATLTPPSTGAFRIYNGQWCDIPFPSTAATFAVIGNVACTARAHLSET